MNRSFAGPGLLAAALSCLSVALPVGAQQVGDEFSSSNNNTGTQGLAYLTRYKGPQLQGSTWGTIGPQWSDRAMYEGGRWQIEPDGAVTFIPNETERDGPDPFSGVDDGPPPNKTYEAFNEQASDPVAISPDDLFDNEFEPDPSVEKSFAKSSRKWPKERMPLRVYVTKRIKLTRNGLVATEIDRSLHDWCTAVHGRVKFVYATDFKNADIYFLERKPSNDDWADNERFYSKKGLDEVRVSLHRQTVAELPQNQVRAVILHETGHALGIIDHVDDPDSAMSLNACDDKKPITKLSDCDNMAIRILYADTPAVVTHATWTYRKLASSNKGSK